ncbi:MAG: CDGSH iron-sulfur domain-containing protein [bacterium]|nr:CDGSH iron-sulfur domain-containing protein [Myxococcales bacterium]MCB9541043.1 CDGSH iron-sulfur domain-containing protein [Myxococcales bacterium]MCB9553867.1 CDGSH iron-sulfur domain-containing protein [Myxococcales bacterium]
MSSSKTHTFSGEQIDVTYHPALCIHVGECGRADNALFVGGRRPWCDPDAVGVDEVLAVVDRCPTGALDARNKDGTHALAPADRNTVTVANNGPLYLRGALHLAGVDGEGETRTRIALCRCGASKNKPFCDNSHEKDGFIDRGAIGTTGQPDPLPAGPLTITPAPDGPLLLSGPVTLVAASGRAAWQGHKAALCRCGASKNKPFCDGSHRAVGFKSAPTEGA